MGDTVGDVDGWLDFAEAAGLRRESVRAAQCLPGVRFAVEGLVNFARRATWLEGIATSLYEIPAKDELLRRTNALRDHYGWIEPEGMKFFASRISRIQRDAETVTDLVFGHLMDFSLRSAVESARHMSDVVWSIHDAIYMNYVIDDKPLYSSF